MRKAILAVLFVVATCVSVVAQKVNVTGKVTDSSGAPIAGATVTEKGTRNAVSANDAGDFTISVSPNAFLIITAVGFQPFEVGSTAAATVILTRDNRGLTEVVVTALGVRKAERALGYAVAKVDPNTFLQKSEPDMLKGLQGKVPGVDIRTSQGTPGAATRIQIRGNSSFDLETQPLIVVDGIPYSNDQVSTSSQTSGGTAYGSGLSNLDPNDIESMNVLKGAAAAALYGSRGSRGVVLITTKSGSAKRGKKPINVNYKTSFSVENVANLPTYQNKYGTGANFAYSNSNGSWGPAFDRAGSPGITYANGSGYFVNPTGTVDSIAAWPEYLNAYPELFSATGRTPYRAYPNNVKDLFRTSNIYENSIGVNGGSESSSVSLTLSNLTHNGYVENSSYIRNNVGLGGQTKYKGLTIGGNVSYSRSSQKGGYFGENQVDGATSQFARSLFLGRNWDLNLPYQDVLGKPLIPNGGAQFDNPHWAAVNNVATTIEERVVAGIRLNYKVSSWMNLSYNFGMNNANLNRKEVTQEFSRAAGGLGRIVTDDYRKQELESTFIIDFNPRIGEDFSLNVRLGNNINQRTVTRQANTGLDFKVPGIYNLVNTSTQTFNVDSRSKRRIVGFFADATLGYKNYAFLNVAARNDRTSTLPSSNSSYYYPTVSGSFVFTDALGIKNNWLDYGKVRAGWARVGNDAEPNNIQDVYDLLGTTFLGQPRATRGNQVTNSNLTPEFTRELELGLDLSLFKRRVNLDFTWYDKISTDLIYPISVPSSTGYSSFYTNIGKISNKGVEIGLTLKPVVTRDFTWDIRGAFTKNKNLVLELVDGLDRAPLRGVLTSISPYLEANMPFGYLRGDKIARSPEGLPLINPATGFMIADNEQGMVGDPNPDYKLGITNTLSYKGFFLNALFDMTKGGDMYSVTVSSLLGRGVTMDTEDREGSFIIPGVYGNANTLEPLLVDGKTVPNQTRITTNDLYFTSAPGASSFAINGATEFNVYDATVYRLREVTLGYDLPATVVKKLGLAGATFSISARNLWYLAPNFPKYTRFDPEVNSFGNSSTQGIELSAAPTTRRFGVNLNVTF
jgi:TonB-linked SusC/RagA family outer membrane protein